MPLLEHAASRFALLYSSSISVVIIGLMLFMAYRLHRSNKRRAYGNLLVSLVFIWIHHLLQLTWSVGWLSDFSALGFISTMLQILSFIVMNFAIFELYYKRRPRTRVWFYGLLALCLLLGAAELFFGMPTGAGQSLSQGDQSPAALLLSIYLVLLAPLFALMFGPHIGQPRKYGAGLAAFFLAQACFLVNPHVTPESHTFLIAADLLNVIYYILLFMLLFERVVELLMSAWRSSITDGLTNLYNRRYLMSQLERALGTGKPVTVVFCDIDNFKRLNDTHGHHRADGVLKQVASLITEETAGIGIAGRYGGEELVAVLTCPRETALQTAETIRARTASESIVTISIGVSTRLPGVSLKAEQLLKQADEAMYHSKSTGKNRVTDYADMVNEDYTQTL